MLIDKNQHLLTRFSRDYDLNVTTKRSSRDTLSDYCEKLNLKDNQENAHNMLLALKQFTHEFCKFIQIQVEHVKEQQDLKKH